MNEVADLMARRKRLLGASSPLFYDRPLQLVRGEGVWVFDPNGNRYLDAYNNVPHVGHCHPFVIDALCRQAQRLNVHTRYLHETILDYAERLTSTFDPTLSRALFCCTGTEANELALRIARANTARSGIIVSNWSYHGNSTTLASLTTAFNAGERRGAAMRTVAVPDPYYADRGTSESAILQKALDELNGAIESLEEEGHGVAAFLVDSIFSTEGLPGVPSAYLAKAVDRVRAAGGLFIADEVQAGFARTGSKMWGYQRHGVVPDIVTLGKPMGNGHPLAAVIARPELADRFGQEALYFNTFGGNPVSAAVGLAVLEVLQREALMENAASVGEYLRNGLAELACRRSLIGDVRGVGLFLAVELVSDPESRAPARRQCRDVVNQMRDRGVLISRIGPRDNVLKIRPPMPFSRENADQLLDTLDAVLAAPGSRRQTGNA